MNRKGYVFLKSLNYQVKAKIYTQKIRKNHLVLSCLDYFILNGIVRLYYSWNTQNLLRVYHNFLTNSQVLFNFVIVLSSTKSIFSIKEESFFLLKKDFPVGFFLITNSFFGLFSDIDVISRKKLDNYGGFLLAWCT